MFDFGFLPKGIVLKKLIWLKASGIVGAAYQTFTGTIARFLSPSSKPVKSIVCNIEPIQDLHGYDNPWPAGGGKNKLNAADAEIGTAWNGSPNTARARLVIPCKASTQYTISMNGTNSMSNIYYTYTASVPASGAGAEITNSFPVTFTTSSASAYIVVAFSKTGVTQSDVNALKLQLELGSSATSYAPYSNICLIYGHTDADVVRTGKNLLDNDGIERTSNNLRIARNSGYGNPILLKAGISYTFFCNSSTRPDGIYIIQPFTSTNIWAQNVSASITVTPTEDTEVGVNFYWASARPDDATALCCVVGDDVTDYEAFSGTTLPVSWQSEAGTVYAGYLSIDKDGGCTLTGTHGYKDLGNLNWNQGVSFQNVFYASVTGAKAGVLGDVQCLCSDYKAIGCAPFSTLANHEKCVCIQQSYSTVGICDGDYADATAFKTAMSGVQLVYELATPVTYTLSSVTVPSTVQGENNWWHDANGNITIEAIGTPISSDEPDALQSLNILLGGAYTPRANFSEPTDEQALNIIMGGSR